MRVRRLLVPYAALALLLAGCGGDSTADPPSPTNPGTTTPSTTESTSPTSPSASETAATESPEEFIRRFVKVKNKMVTTGETRAFLRLADPDCGYCRGFADTVASIYADGGQITTRGWLIQRIKPMGPSGNRLEFRVRIVSAPTDYQESKSGPVKHLSGGPSNNLFTLTRTDELLTVAEVEELAE